MARFAPTQISVKKGNKKPTVKDFLPFPEPEEKKVQLMPRTKRTIEALLKANKLPPRVEAMARLRLNG